MTYNFVSLCIMGLMLSTTFTTVVPQAQMTLQYEGTSVGFAKGFHFTPQTYSEFYNCLCGDTTTECTAPYKTSTNPPTILNPAQSRTVTDNQSYYSNYFQCKNSASNVAIHCTRVKQQDLVCSQSYKFTTLPKANTIICNKDCLGLVWLYPAKEKLIFNSVTQNKTSCQAECYGQTVTTPSTLLSHESPSTERVTNAEQGRGSDDNDSMPIIIGVVVGVILIIVLVVIITCVMYRRKKHKQERNNQNPTTRTFVSNESHTNDIDDYNTVCGDLASDVISDSATATRTTPVPYQVTVPSGNDTYRSNSTVNPHNAGTKKAVVVDDFGYSTANMDEKMYWETRKANSSTGNPLENGPDPLSRELVNSTETDLPVYAEVNKNDKTKPNYFNALAKREGGQSSSPPPASADLDLPEYAVVNKSRSGPKPKDYFNSLAPSDGQAKPTPPPASAKPKMATSSKPAISSKPRVHRSSYDTVDIVGDSKENYPQIRSDVTTEGNDNTTDNDIPEYSVVDKTGKRQK